MYYGDSCRDLSPVHKIHKFSLDDSSADEYDLCMKYETSEKGNYGLSESVENCIPKQLSY